MLYSVRPFLSRECFIALVKRRPVLPGSDADGGDGDDDDEDGKYRHVRQKGDRRQGLFFQGDADGHPGQERDGADRADRADDVTAEIGPAQALPAHR